MYIVKCVTLVNSVNSQIVKNIKVLAEVPDVVRGISLCFFLNIHGFNKKNVS